MATDSRTTILEKVIIADRETSSQEALQLLAPKGWRVTGGPKWYGSFVHQVSFEVRVDNPFGLERVEWLPTYWFTHSTDAVYAPPPMNYYQGQVWLQPHGAVEMLENITVPGFRKDLQPRITQRELLNELAEAMARKDGQLVQAGRVRIEYQQNGLAYEEDFFMVLTYYTLRTPTGTITNWSPAIMPFTIRAEKGHLDKSSALLLSIAYSLQPTAEFYKQIRLKQTQAIGNLAEIQRLDRLDAREIAKSRTDIAEIYQNIWNERVSSQERTFQTRQDLLGGVAPYQSQNATYVLPNTHKYQWVIDDGTTVILTDDINYDPSIGSRVNWQRLQEVIR